MAEQIRTVQNANTRQKEGQGKDEKKSFKSPQDKQFKETITVVKEGS